MRAAGRCARRRGTVRGRHGGPGVVQNNVSVYSRWAAAAATSTHRSIPVDLPNNRARVVPSVLKVRVDRQVARATPFDGVREGHFDLAGCRARRGRVQWPSCGGKGACELSAERPAELELSCELSCEHFGGSNEVGCNFSRLCRVYLNGGLLPSVYSDRCYGSTYGGGYYSNSNSSQPLRGSLLPAGPPVQKCMLRPKPSTTSAPLQYSSGGARSCTQQGDGGR